MKNIMKHIKRYSLYLLLPFIFFALIHLTFSYAQWDLNPSSWSELARYMSSIIGIGAFVIGIIVAEYIINN